MSAPRNVLERILRARGLNNDDGIGRAARATLCPNCRRIVLRGLDGDRCASPATVDPQPLTPTGELDALLTGRHTYRLWPAAGHHELTRREPLHLTQAPSLDVVVLADHHCHAGPLDHYPTPPPTAREATVDQPPY